MSCETIETLLQESLLVLNHIDKYDMYLEYLHSEWLYTVEDLKLAFTNETTYLNLKIPARLKLELVALLNQTESSKMDDEDKEEKDDESYSLGGGGGSSSSAGAVQETSKEWVSCYSTEYECYYYYNTLTYESSWECPDPTLHYEYMEYVPSNEEQQQPSATEETVDADSKAAAFSRPKAAESKSSIFKASPKHTELPDTPPAAVRAVNSKLLPRGYAEAKGESKPGKTIFDNSDSSDEEEQREEEEQHHPVSRREAEGVTAGIGSGSSSRGGGGSAKLQSNGHTVIYNKGAVVGAAAGDAFSTTRAVANSGRKAKPQSSSSSSSAGAAAGAAPILAVAVPVPSRGIFDIDDTEEDYSTALAPASRRGGTAATAGVVDPRAQFAAERGASELNDSFYLATVGGSGDSVKLTGAPSAQQQQQGRRKHPPSTSYPGQRAAGASEGPGVEYVRESELFLAPPGSEGPAALSGYQGYNSRLRSKPSPRESSSGGVQDEVSPRGGASSKSSSSSHSREQRLEAEFKANVATAQSNSVRNSSGSSTRSSSNGLNQSGKPLTISINNNKGRGGRQEDSSSSEDEGREVSVRAPRQPAAAATLANQQQQQQSLRPLTSLAVGGVLPSAPPADPIYDSPVGGKHHSHSAYLERITPPPRGSPESPLAAAIRGDGRGGGGGGGLNSYIVTTSSTSGDSLHLSHPSAAGAVNYLDLAIEEQQDEGDEGDEGPPLPKRSPQEGVASPPSNAEEHLPRKKKGGRLKKAVGRLLHLFGGGGGGGGSSGVGKKYRGSDPKVAQLVGMGFDEQEAMYALAMCDGDVGLSCKMLRHKDEEEQEEEEGDEDEDEGADHFSEPYR